MKVLGVIPVRGGSKSIPRKNLADVNGRPLLSFIIEAALAAKRLDRVVVSTEDEEIASEAKRWGAEVPFQRPQELAVDEIGLVPVVQHAMRAMDELGFVADAIVSVQATSPFLGGDDIDRAVAKLQETDADSVASVQPVDHQHPFWVKRLEDDRILSHRRSSSSGVGSRADASGKPGRRARSLTRGPALNQLVVKDFTPRFPPFPNWWASESTDTMSHDRWPSRLS